MFRNVEHARYVLEHLRRERESKSPEVCTDACDWCDEQCAVADLRNAGELFDTLPDGDPLVGDICPACVQREHTARERESGRYHGTDFTE